MRKNEKNLKSLTRSNGTACACGGTAEPPQFPPITKFFFLPLLPHSNNTTSFTFKLLSLNLHNLNLQTSITFFKLHQITQFLNQNNFKLHPKPNPPIKNNNHPSQPIKHQIRVTHNPNPKTPISSSILTTNSNFLLKTQTHH